MRFGRTLFETLCSASDTEILYTHPIISDDDKNADINEITNDVIAIMTNFTAKISARKASEVVKIPMDSETLKLGLSLVREGYSFRFIEREFRRLNIRDHKGKFYTRGIIYRRIMENRNIVSLLTGNTEEPEIKKGTFNDFWSKHITKSGNPTYQISHSAIVKAYQRFCDKGGYEAISNQNLSGLMQKKDLVKKRTAKGFVYEGISISKGRK